MGAPEFSATWTGATARVYTSSTATACDDFNTCGRLHLKWRGGFHHGMRAADCDMRALQLLRACTGGQLAGTSTSDGCLCFQRSKHRLLSGMQSSGSDL